MVKHSYLFVHYHLLTFVSLYSEVNKPDTCSRFHSRGLGSLSITRRPSAKPLVELCVAQRHHECFGGPLDTRTQLVRQNMSHIVIISKAGAPGFIGSLHGKTLSQVSHAAATRRFLCASGLNSTPAQACKTVTFRLHRAEPSMRVFAFLLKPKCQSLQLNTGATSCSVLAAAWFAVVSGSSSIDSPQILKRAFCVPLFSQLKGSSATTSRLPMANAFDWSST